MAYGPDPATQNWATDQNFSGPGGVGGYAPAEKSTSPKSAVPWFDDIDLVTDDLAPGASKVAESASTKDDRWGNYHNSGKAHPGDDQRGEDVLYIYTDPAGRPYQGAKRYYKQKDGKWQKHFAQQHYANGSWINGAPKGPKFPFQLPALIAAPLDEPIFIPEGEKDCLTLRELGLVATTNPGGSKVWQPELASWFIGRKTIFILEDNDDAGRPSGSIPSIIMLTAANSFVSRSAALNGF